MVGNRLNLNKDKVLKVIFNEIFPMA